METKSRNVAMSGRPSEGTVASTPAGLRDSAGNILPFGSALIANKLGSYAIEVIATPEVWPNIKNTTPDLQYNSSTGVFTFLTDCFFLSNVSWRCTSAGNESFYADAEFIAPGDSVWTRGTESGREDSQGSKYRTNGFAFMGHFPKGTQLRFVRWAEGTGVTCATATNGGSTFPASRITVTTFPGSKF